MSTMTKRLKSELWRRFGSREYPAEWDGTVYGGGKISQRNWEYFKAIELLELSPGSRILDIGGGSPATGLSFFPRLLASMELKIAVLDINFGSALDIPTNVEIIRGLADKESLGSAIKSFEPTHISCVSVLEHASSGQQSGIFEAIEEAFYGSCFVCTLEFHETQTFFEQQLTTKTLSRIVSPLKRYYLSDIQSTPFHCVDAVENLQRKWYPLALKFELS